MDKISRLYAKKPTVKRSNSALRIQRNKSSQQLKSPADRILFLQQTIGNQAVQRLIKSRTLQAKLRIGQPGDRYEQETDRVADAVMRMPEPGVQRQPIEDEEEEQIQTKPVTEQITPLVQRQVEEEEEELQMKVNPSVIQHQEPEEDEILQGKMSEVVQRQPEEEEEEPLQAKFTSGLTGTLQAKTEASQNNTGMPDHLKSGLENLSNMNLSNVRVHHNSSKPAQLDALAYTQGQDIHVGPGQEKHLPHEGWHAVQQMQGRVKPTMQAKGVSINDDASLEQEADVKGVKALQMAPAELVAMQSGQQGGMSLRWSHVVPQTNSSRATVQRAPNAAQQAQWETDWNDASLQRYRRHFKGAGRPSGTAEERYDDLCPLYFARGIQRPLIYIKDHIVEARFFQFTTSAHSDLAAALTIAETSLKGKRYTDPLPFLSSGVAFNPRTTSEGNWSNHADGKAIDFDPDLNPRLSNKNQRNIISALTGFDMTKPNPGADAGMDSYDASKAASERFQEIFNSKGMRARLETLTGQQDFIATRIMTTRGHLDFLPKGRAATAEDKKLRVELVGSLKERKKEARSVAAQIRILKKELKNFENLDDAISKLQMEILLSHLSVFFLDSVILIATGSEKNRLKRKKKAIQRAVKKSKKRLNKKEKQRDSDKLRQYSRTGFLNLPKDIVTALTDAGLEWGGDWGKPHSKDFMHFEVS